MSIRIRHWRSPRGSRYAWVADTVDGNGKRHMKTFDRKRDAEIYHMRVSDEVRAVKMKTSTRDEVRVLIAIVLRLDRSIDRLVRELRALKRREEQRQ